MSLREWIAPAIIVAIMLCGFSLLWSAISANNDALMTLSSTNGAVAQSVENVNVQLAGFSGEVRELSNSVDDLRIVIARMHPEVPPSPRDE